MSEIQHHRTIRPSSRKASSVSYKVDTKKVTKEDTLLVEIDHEKNNFYQRFWFNGDALAGKESIHFTVEEFDDSIKIKWSGAQPRLIPTPTVMLLQSEWFEMGYYVYVVVMRRENEKYFYVGMTGDRQHKTARSPFYRMSGHFSRLAKSTENQIIKALKSYWPKQDIESLLLKVQFSYYAYKMASFDSKDTAKHDEKRKFVEKVESSLIEQLKGVFGVDHVVNTNRSSRHYEDVLSIGKEILSDLEKRINV